MSQEWMYLLRILYAAGCGFIIGFERKMRLKEAGIRTHTIVSVGAALFMMISKYGFADTGGQDTSRIAAQVVSGIGFLGAGMILYKREALHGLTTAAGIWTTAAVGMCVGSGLYILAIGTTVILVLIHVMLHLPIRILYPKPHQIILIEFAAGEDNMKTVKAMFDTQKFLKVHSFMQGERVMCSATLRTYVIHSEEAICGIMRDNDFITSIDRLEEE